ncbi:hypothetical protein LCGC14_1654020 [marine sediment metagenome]|uniref:Bacteriophage T4 Gp32 single-stranded DNA-binding domain-containing protein n=1 Tax=marine sediment metagenome TaxID=412755 RepID=A0A0F9KWA6_9ZZZZ
MAKGKGIHQAEDAASAGFLRQPKVRLKSGDRVRFHFLSTGEDDFFGGGRFHMFPQKTQAGKTWTKEVLCVRAFTDGEEECSHCDEGHDDMGNRFAVWVYAHFVLHLGDNPNQGEGEEPWEQVKMGKRVMFKETIDLPLMIWMPYGRGFIWFGQFREAVVKYGTLLGRLFELKRVGSGMQDTDYTLAVVKEVDLEKKIQKEIDKSDVVTTIEVAMRETVSSGSASPAPARLSEEEEASEDEASEEEAPAAGDVPEMEEPAEELV